MAIIVCGTATLDTIETPSERVEEVLGGSGVYAAVAASFFHNPVQLVGVVGGDFPQTYASQLESFGIELRRLTRVENGKTFRWGCKYAEDFNVREMLFAHLNVVAEVPPAMDASSSDAPYLFLANNPPHLQLDAIARIPRPKLVVCDTMDVWINTARAVLEETLARVDILILNDSEARLFTGDANVVRAARAMLRYGPQRVIVKKGEHGAISVTESSFFSAPAYPLTHITDATGAGDSFAGALIGYLASINDASEDAIRRAMIYGTAVASFTIEDFSINRQTSVQFSDISARYAELQEAVRF